VAFLITMRDVVALWSQALAGEAVAAADSSSEQHF